MDAKRLSLTLLILLISSLSPVFGQGLYFNGHWDEACSKCWSAPRTAANFHCKPTDCAIQGYYHCKIQSPPLAIDDDPRLIGLVKTGQCQYVPHTALNADEAHYVQGMQQCTQVLDRMAGRYVMDANPQDARRNRADFHLTRFKALVLGNGKAQLKLAMDYDLGLGTHQDRSRATMLYQQAALNGISYAQYAIGARYAYGIGMPQDKDKAIEWLNKALRNQPLSAGEMKAHTAVMPCAMKLLEKLTLV